MLSAMTVDTLAAIYQTRLLRHEAVADKTMAFHFQKPEGFRHRAGQSLLMTLINPVETDSLGDVRTFTIASAPDEPDLMIATRMRDTAFKRSLLAAPAGTIVQIDGPEGEMVLHEDAARPAVFLAGGMGITPFLSMARHAALRRLPHSIWLFYANRRREDAAFLAELQQMAQSNPRFHVVPLMSEAGPSWTGETGYIRRDLLEKYVADPGKPVYYLAGPPAMSMAMQRMLREMGIPAGSVRHEEFYGY